MKGHYSEDFYLTYKVKNCGSQYFMNILYIYNLAYLNSKTLKLK